MVIFGLNENTEESLHPYASIICFLGGCRLSAFAIGVAGCCG